MVCTTSCIVAGAFIISSIFLCLRVDKQTLKDPLFQLLSDENSVEFNPKFIRILRYEYVYSDWNGLKNGFYWKRQFVNTYLEPISVSN